MGKMYISKKTKKTRRIKKEKNAKRKEIKRKKGILLLKFVLGLVIGIIVLVILFYTLKLVWNVFFGAQEEKIAKGMLEKFNRLILSAEKSEEGLASDLFHKLEGWSFVFIPQYFKESSGFKKPEKYLDYNVICICKKKKCNYCNIIPKKIQDEKNDLLILELKDFYYISIYLSKHDNYYLYSLSKHIQFSMPTEREKESIIKTLESKEKIAKMIIDEAKENGVDPSLVLAIVLVESNFNEKAVSPCASVGIMQLIPATAIQYGLKVGVKVNGVSYVFNDYPSYKQFLNEKNLWKEVEECDTLVSPCNSENLKYCDFEKDERFNIDKSIEVGIKYLKDIQNSQEFKNLKGKDFFVDYWIAAYHDGIGGVLKKCKIDETFKPAVECLGETTQYVSKVKKYKIITEEFLESLESERIERIA